MWHDCESIKINGDIPCSPKSCIIMGIVPIRFSLGVKVGLFIIINGNYILIT